MGFCSGSRTTPGSSTAAIPATGRTACSTTSQEDFVCFIDESHQTVPQIGGMYEGDRSRKQTLVDYGFRLPSAMDNRPQTFAEFLSITPQMVFVSATPGRVRAHPVAPDRGADRAPHGDHRSRGRGPGDPQPDRRPDERDPGPNVDREERTLVTTLTKKMSEDLTDYLLEMGFKRPVSALGDRHAGTDPDHPRPAPGRIRRAGRSQPSA